MSGITLDLLLLQIVTGIALGAVYVLVALGLSLIFGMLAVVNFAHGAFFMVGAYMGVWLFAQTGNFWVCLVLVPLGVGAIGLLTERVLVRPLYRTRHRLPAAIDLRAVVSFSWKSCA